MTNKSLFLTGGDYRWASDPPMVVKSKPQLMAVFAILLPWNNAAFLYIYRGFLTSPVFWVGYLFFGLLGSFISGSERPTIESYSRILMFATVLGAAIAYVRYPVSRAFAAGFAGFFTGGLTRGIFWVKFKAEWIFCDVCGDNRWAVKKKDGLYCPKGHLIQSTESSGSDRRNF